jgi:hypothetical protein
MAKPSKVLRYEDRVRKPVLPGQKVPLTLSHREHELILNHTLADEELTAPLRAVPISNKASVYSFTLDDLEELVGYVAAEANHAKDKKLQKELDRLFARMETVPESYTDEDDRSTD